MCFSGCCVIWLRSLSRSSVPRWPCLIVSGPHCRWTRRTLLAGWSLGCPVCLVEVVGWPPCYLAGWAAASLDDLFGLQTRSPKTKFIESTRKCMVLVANYNNSELPAEQRLTVRHSSQAAKPPTIGRVPEAPPATWPAKGAASGATGVREAG